MLDLSNFINQWALPTIGLVLTGLVSWLVWRTNQWLDAHAKFLSASTKAKIAATEAQALNEGAQYLMTWLASQSKDIKVPVDGAVTRFAAQIAINHAGGVLAAHGASPEEIAAKILARLPSASVSLDTTGATVPLPQPVTSQPLQPIGDTP